MNDPSCSCHERENYLIPHQGVHACQICTCANHDEMDATQKVPMPQHSSLHERIQMTKARTHTHTSIYTRLWAQKNMLMRYLLGCHGYAVKW